MTSLALVRGWRAVLISDCYTEGKGTFSFRGVGGSWLVVCNGRCGVLIDRGMANMWRRGGERRRDSPDGRSLAVVVPCAGRGFGVVFFLLSRFTGRFQGRLSIKRGDGCSTVSLPGWVFFLFVRFGWWVAIQCGNWFSRDR